MLQIKQPVFNDPLIAMLTEMKMPSSFRRGAIRPSDLRQILCAGLVCATAWLAAGCGKQAQSPAPPAPAPQDTNASQPAPAAPATPVNSGPALAATATNATVDLRPLNQALMGWVYRNGRRPANFEEFAASAGIQIPPPPPGKKYSITGRGFISLVNANPN